MPNTTTVLTYQDSAVSISCAGARTDGRRAIYAYAHGRAALETDSVTDLVHTIGHVCERRNLYAINGRPC